MPRDRLGLWALSLLAMSLTRTITTRWYVPRDAADKVVVTVRLLHLGFDQPAEEGFSGMASFISAIRGAAFLSTPGRR